MMPNLGDNHRFVNAKNFGGSGSSGEPESTKYKFFNMLTSALDYALPPDLIAATPADPRDSARLLVIDRRTGALAHHHVRDLPRLNVFHPGDLLIFNQTKVLPARFLGTRSATTGRIKGLYLATPDPADPTLWEVLLESRGSLQPDERIRLDDQSELTLLERQPSGGNSGSSSGGASGGGGGQWLTRLHSPISPLDLLQRIGSTPLPPYILKERKARHLPQSTPDDALRYNTVYARDPGSVAAPTAGLHFTPDLLQQLDARGIRRACLTLHVGLGTFAPVRTEHLQDHRIHSEWLDIPAATIGALRAARQHGSRIIPIGTTTVRALESLPAAYEEGQGFQGHTTLFITPFEPGQPPFPFRFTDALLTNFHLPRSTLLALVAALPGVGLDQLKAWYTLAIAHRYRFYSFGDAMLLV